MGQKSTFYLENKNSETTFISSTFKVEEIKVVSEFLFSKQKVDFWAISYLDLFKTKIISSKIKNGPKIHFLLGKSKF